MAKPKRRKKRTAAALRNEQATKKPARISESEFTQFKEDVAPEELQEHLPPELLQNDKGHWEVSLKHLPKGTSRKGLITFLGPSVAVPTAVHLESGTGSATLTFTSLASAKSCLQRYQDLDTALTSAPATKRRRSGSTWNSWWGEVDTEVPPVTVAPTKPMESQGFSESEEEMEDGRGFGTGASFKKAPEGPDLQKMIRKIAAFAAQRRLHDAIKAFDEISLKGLQPSVQAYASLINAHVNSGDMSGAASVFQKMLDNGLRSNVVVCTALLKGYCRAGDVPGAMQVLESMLSQDPPVKPDMRLINTLLRGCLRVSDLPTAERVFQQLEEWQLQPDATSCSFMASLWAQDLRAKSIALLLQLPPLADPSASTLSVQDDQRPSSSLAAKEEACRFWAKGKCSKGSACSFFHDPKVAEAKLDFTEPERLSAVASVRVCLAWATLLTDGSKASKTRGDVIHLAEQALAASKARPLTKKSLKENQESKQREQELEVQLLRDLVERTGGKKPSTAEFLGRCFVLPALAEERTLATGKQNSRVVEELAHWGLKRFRLAVQKSLRERFSKCFDATGRLIWKEVFQGSSGAVKLELGAGSGEWVAAQATADRESAWVALELMRDRAHSILRRAIAKDLRNLYIFSGDALEMLRLLFPNTSVAHIFINFPEPPFVSGNEAAESSFHMMTSELFVQMHRVLQKGCDVTILSDNQRYMKSLADTAGSLVEQGLFRSVDLSTGKPLETLRGVTIYQGWPEKRSGHLVKSSSYFDSHWAKGQRLDRFYLLLRKVRKSGKDA